MDYKYILWEKSDGIGTLTMNRPERLNALNVQIGVEMLHAIEAAEHDPEVRVLVLTGAGRGFCAGDDLKGMEDPSAPPGTENKYSDPAKQYVYGQGRWVTVVRNMMSMPKPVLGVINGHAHGAGFNLALGCDLRIMSDTATMAVPFLKWGMATGTNRLHQFVGVGKAIEWGLLAQPLSAQEAERWGLVTRVVPHAELADRARELALRLADGPTAAIGFTKHAIYRGWDTAPDIAYEYQGAAQGYAKLTYDMEEGRAAFREKRAPKFEGR